MVNAKALQRHAAHAEIRLSPYIQGRQLQRGEAAAQDRGPCGLQPVGAALAGVREEGPHTGLCWVICAALRQPVGAPVWRKGANQTQDGRGP